MICAKRPRPRRALTALACRARGPFARRAGSGSSAVAALAIVAVLPVTAGSAAPAGRPAGHAAAAAAANVFSPSYLHPYRRGVVPTIGRLGKMRSWLAARPRLTGASPGQLSYGGGVHGIGVTTGRERVYLVFFGSQWGTAGTDGSGDVTLSGDPSGAAPYLQRLYRGLGTNGETWSAVMTQYCQGVPAGAVSCPANGPHVLHAAYPVPSALAGVWVDESAAAPQQATGHQLAAEAILAASHFHNTTAALNRDAMYVIASPTGTNPDGFETGGGFCAWHDWNGDPTLTGGPAPSSSGDIAFTNLPYLTDAGAQCGANFVTGAGALDGVSMVAGHEFAETVTDQNPTGGWTDAQGNEAGDRCSWVAPGLAGGAADVSLATGTFAMQSIWSNSANGGSGGCQLGGVVNGGFEAGSFAGWSASGWARVVAAGARSGRYAARLGRPAAAPGNARITAVFTAGSPRLSVWYRASCPGTVSTSWLTASLTDNTAGTTAVLLAKTCEQDSRWRKLRHGLVPGHDYTLTLTNHDGLSSGAGAYALVDDITAS